MAEADIAPFAVWSLTTLAIVVVTGLTYRAYARRNQNAKSPS